MLRPVHDRMPVILHPDDYELWLDGDLRKPDLVKYVLRPYPAAEMVGYPIGTAVNSPRNQGGDGTELKLSRGRRERLQDGGRD